LKNRNNQLVFVFVFFFYKKKLETLIWNKLNKSCLTWVRGIWLLPWDIRASIPFHNAACVWCTLCFPAMSEKQSLWDIGHETCWLSCERDKVTIGNHRWKATKIMHPFPLWISCSKKPFLKSIPAALRKKVVFFISSLDFLSISCEKQILIIIKNSQESVM